MADLHRHQLQKNIGLKRVRLCPPIWLAAPQGILGFVSLNGDIFPFILLAYQLAHYAKPLYCAAFIPQWQQFGFHFTKGERRCIV